MAVAPNAAYITGASLTLTVAAAKTGYTSPSDFTNTLTVDLTAPTAPSYAAPTALTVGVAITPLIPAGGTGIATSNGHAAAGLPAGLALDVDSGAIAGTPTAHSSAEVTATVTVTDRAGNSAAVSIDFPAVARGAQDLAAFAYTPASLNYNAAAPILTPPTVLEDAVLSYDAATTPDVCTVDANGALAILAVGTCTVTVTAAATANYTADETTAMVTVNPAGTLMLAVHDVTGDDIINSTEQADGFSIEGHTGTEAGVTVTVTLGGHSFAAVDSALAVGATDAAWSVAVAPNAAYITGASLTLTVAAAKTGYTSPSDFTNTLTVDLTAPTAPSYAAPTALTVGVAITPLIPAGGTGIATSNGHAAAGLPAGLALDVDSGAIAGTPSARSSAQVTATVTVTDRAGNSAEVSIDFPAVARGAQDLSAFAYTPASLNYNAAAPTLTPPTVLEDAVLSYDAATTPDVCTVDANGALAILAVGTCTVTVTAAATANYTADETTAMVTVNPAGTLMLAVHDVTGDNIINSTEQADGFSIEGHTGTEAGVTVTVTLGGHSFGRSPRRLPWARPTPPGRWPWRRMRRILPARP